MSKKNFELLEGMAFGVIDGKPVLCEKANCSKCLFRPFANNQYKGSSIEKRRQWLKETTPPINLHNGELVYISGLGRSDGLYVVGGIDSDGYYQFYRNPVDALNKITKADLMIYSSSLIISSVSVLEYHDDSDDKYHTISYTKLRMR